MNWILLGNRRYKNQKKVFKSFFKNSRETINQLAYHAPKLIKKASKEVRRITKQKITQLISQGEQNIEHKLSKIIRDAIEQIYQTPTGSKISYFDDNDLSLPQFRSGGNDSKNRSERYSNNKKASRNPPNLAGSFEIELT